MKNRSDLLNYYLHVIDKLKNRKSILNNKSKKFGYLRLSVLFAGIAGLLVSFFFISNLTAWIFFFLIIVTSAILSHFHNKIENGIKRNNIYLNIKQINFARIKIDWKNIPLPEFEKYSSEHPFEKDLNITGKKSLQHLIDLSISKDGSLELKKLLTSVKLDLEQILKRQNIIEELIPHLRFRDKLQLVSNYISKKEFDGKKISEWLLSSLKINEIKRILTILWVVIPVNILLFLLFIFGVIPAYFIFTSFIYLAIVNFNNNYVDELFDKSLVIYDEIKKFSSVLKFIENYNFKNAENLNEFLAPVKDKHYSPSALIKKLEKTISLLGAQKNPFIRIFVNAAFPWDFHFAHQLELLKKETGERLNNWLQIWYSLEAYNSLANFAYINPEYNFPEINDNEKFVFRSSGIRHPLIPFDKNVDNNFSLNKNGEVIIITGSNMSGKSTFLKTLGVNLSLAYAGSVTCAESLNTSLFRLFTCINISDSVTDQISYFYAEVTRLKKLLNEIESENKYPVFFLIDEIFRGTNNVERLKGSRSYIKNILNKNCTGFISTHDLELVNLEKEFDLISNYHFKERIEKDKMVFDYKLKEGPSPTTNALNIMKMEGLPVEQ